MKIHPVASLFPPMNEQQLKILTEDIKAQGLQQAIVIQTDTLLDGRNRLAACKLAGIEPKFIEYKGDNPVAFIAGANLKRRDLTINQKIAIGIDLEPYFAAEAKKRILKGKADPVGTVPTGSGRSRDLAADLVGVSGKTISRAKAIKKASPARFEKIRQGKMTIAKARREIKIEENKAALKAAQKTITADKAKNLANVCELRICSCAELLASGIKPDAIITDPPYAHEFLPLFSELAEGCAKANIPLVAVMSGQTYLPEVMRRLCEHLTYRWMLAYMTPGGQSAKQWQVKVNTSWKPVLLFGEALEWFGDVAISKANDKRFHDWGQSESGMADLVERLTKPGQLICDPFLGGGTTAVVSLALARRFIGSDIDAECVEKTRLRMKMISCEK